MSRVNLFWGVIAAIVVCVTGFAGLVQAQEAPQEAGPATSLVERTEEVLKKLTSESTSGVAVLVARDGKVVLTNAAGMANIEEKIPVTIETKFRIGSISKQFTALAIVRLAEQGKLSLQDPLEKYYPDFPNAASITLEHMITHTSGLHSYTERPDFYGRVTEAAKPEEIIKWFKNDTTEFSPGEKFKYCNTGYFLLGEIVGQVSESSYAAFLEKEFFEPLGMKDTGVYNNGDVPENMALGYSWADDKYGAALDWDMCWAGGAGALYSTVGDLHRWNEALFSGQVVSPGALEVAITPFALPPGSDSMNYGYGLFVAEYRRLPMISHSGGLNGWTSDLAYFPQQKCTIAVLTNAHPAPPGLTPQVISRRLADGVLAEVFQAAPAWEVDASIDPTTFADYVGRYDYQGAVAEVTFEDGKLFAQLTDQERLEILPLTKDEFFWKNVEASVRFERDGQGQVVSARHTQNGVTFTAPKITAFELSEEAVDAFVGRYRYGLAMMITTRQGRQLYAQLTGQPKFPIFPISENTFEWRVVEAKVEFVKDETGEVALARHTQGGTTFDAARIKSRKRD